MPDTTKNTVRWKWISGDYLEEGPITQLNKGKLTNKQEALAACQTSGYRRLCSVDDLCKTPGSCKPGWTDDAKVGYYAKANTPGLGEGTCTGKGWNEFRDADGLPVGGAFCCDPDPNHPGPSGPTDPVDNLGFCQTTPPKCVPRPEEPKIIKCGNCLDDTEAADADKTTGVWLYRGGHRFRIDDCRCPAAAKAALIHNAEDGNLCGTPLQYPNSIKPYQPKVIPKKAAGQTCEYSEDCRPGFLCRKGDKRCLTEEQFRADQARDGVHRDGTLLTKYPLEIYLSVGSSYYVRPASDPSSMLVQQKGEWVVAEEKDIRTLQPLLLKQDPNDMSQYIFQDTDSHNYLDLPGGSNNAVPWSLNKMDYHSYTFQCRLDMRYVTYEQILHLEAASTRIGESSSAQGYLAACPLGETKCSHGGAQYVPRTQRTLDASTDVQQWRLTGMGKSLGDRVKYGDIVGITLSAKSLLEGDLGTCDAIHCQYSPNNSYKGIVVGPTGASSTDPRMRWIIEGGHSGTEVMYGDNVYLRAYLLVTDEPYVQISEYAYLDCCDTSKCGDQEGGVLQTTVGRIGNGRVATGQSAQWNFVRFQQGANPMNQYLARGDTTQGGWKGLHLVESASSATHWILEPLDISKYINQTDTQTSDCGILSVWKDDNKKWFTNGAALLPDGSFADNQIFYTDPVTQGITTVPSGKCELNCGSDRINICGEIGGKILDCNEPQNRDACVKAIYHEKPNPFQPVTIDAQCFNQIPVMMGDAPTKNGLLPGIRCDHSELFNPRSVDASLALDSSRTDLFVGDKVFRIVFRDDTYAIADTFPLPITTVYPGLPSDLDTAFRMTTKIFWDGTRENILGFFLKGDYCYTWDMLRNEALRRFRISEIWTGVPSGIEAAWYDERTETLYLYKEAICYQVFPYQVIHGMYVQRDANTINTLVMLERGKGDKTGYDSMHPEQDKYTIFSRDEAAVACRMNGGVLATQEVLQAIFENGEAVLLDLKNPKLTKYEYLGGEKDDPYIYSSAAEGNRACQEKGFRGLCTRDFMNTTQGQCACGWNANDSEPGYLMTTQSQFSDYAKPLVSSSGKPNYCGNIGWNTCNTKGGAYCCNPIRLLGYAGWIQDVDTGPVSVTRDAKSFRIDPCRDAPCRERGGAWCFLENNASLRVAGTSMKATIQKTNPNYPAYIDAIMELPRNPKYDYDRYILVGAKVYGVKDTVASPLGDTLASFISGMPERTSHMGEFQEKVCAEQKEFQALEKKLKWDYNIDTAVYRETELAKGKANAVLTNQNQQIGINTDALADIRNTDDSESRQTEIQNQADRIRGSHLFVLKVILVTLLSIMGLYGLSIIPVIAPYSSIPRNGMIAMVILWALYAIFWNWRKNANSHPLRWGLYRWLADDDMYDDRPIDAGGDDCIVSEEDSSRELDRDQTDGRTIPDDLPKKECRKPGDCAFCESNTYHEKPNAADGNPVRICGGAPDGTMLSKRIINEKWCVSNTDCDYCSSGSSHIPDPKTGDRVCGPPKRGVL